MERKIYLSVVSVFFLCFLSYNEANAQIQKKTVEQIQLLIQEKVSRTPTERKIDSRLLQALREASGKKMTAGVDLEKVNVDADAAGNLDVDINTEAVDNVVTRIEALGGRIIFPSWKYNTIRARIKLSLVETIAGYAEVKFIEPAIKGLTVGSVNRARNLQKDNATAGITKNPAPVVFGFMPKPSFAERAARVRRQLNAYLEKQQPLMQLVGTVTSEGDHAHRADDVRNTYGYMGQGIKIGVLSDSYDALGDAATDVANGDLPGPANPFGNTTAVTVVADFGSGSDEGRAMLQIVHDLAPKAQLFFATADNSEASFATNIQALRNAPNNCDIIIDDVFYFDEPVFQDGIVAQAVNTVTSGGALYFSSAGNEGNLAKGTSGVFEGDFNDAGSPVFAFPGGAKSGTIHNFGTVGTPVNGDIITAVGDAYTLNWADASGSSGNDYDLFVVSSTGTVKASSTNIQSGTQDPFEFINPPSLAAGDRLVVFKTAAAQVRAFSINTIRGTLTNGTTGQTHGHSAAVNAFSVSAAPAADPFGGGSPTGPFPGVYNAANQVELFTSDGPRRVFYNANGTAITAGNFLFATNGGSVRNKPDLTAADGVSTTLASGSGLNPFYGTSAAAPHAGAIAALLKSANPSLTTAQIRTILTTTALDIESAGYDNISGFGIVQAFQAMQAVNPTGLPNINLGTITVTEASPTNSNGSIDPGEGGRIVVQLKNSSLVSAPTVNATLTTSTSGITISQNAASYGTIAASGNASNNATKFAFAVAPATPCGTVIDFRLTVSFGGGGVSPQIFNFTVSVGNNAGTISSTLGSTPPTSSLYISATGIQTGRLSRNGTASDCSGLKTNPGLTTATGARAFDSYKFTNVGASSQCVTVTMNAANGSNMYTAAYDNSGYVPASPGTNYLADPGSSTPPQTFAFTAPAGQSFTVVVHAVTPGDAVGSPYTLDVSLSSCAGGLVVLPVTWLSFTAKEQNSQVALEWKVANEINVSRYEIEHSVDGVNFSMLNKLPATTDASVEKTYDWLHTFPKKGNNYYRIRQVDRDGHYSYSTIQLVKIDKQQPILVAPNPATTYINIQSASVINHIMLYNATGQLLMNIAPAKDNYQLPVAHLPAGQYSIRIETDDEITNRKIIKE